MASFQDDGTRLHPFSSPAAARLSLKNRPVPSRILAVAEHGYSLRLTEPLIGLEWCRVAAEVVTTEFDPKLRGKVLAYYANSLRVVGHYDEAKEEVESALAAAPGDPFILEIKGSLLRDIRQLDEAAECLQSASMRRRASGDMAAYARTVLGSAHVMDETGLSREASKCALKALDILTAEVDPSRHLMRTAIQNYATFLCNAGKPLEALRALRIGAPLLEGGGQYFDLRVEWLYGRISASLREASAESKLTTVRDKLAEGGLIQEAALATLDLARYYVLVKDPRAADTALSVAPLLQTLGIERDAREAEILGKIAEADKTSSNLEFLISELYGVVAARIDTRRRVA